MSALSLVALAGCPPGGEQDGAALIDAAVPADLAVDLAPPAPDLSRLDVDLLDAGAEPLDTFVSAALSKARVPGLSAAIVRRGAVVSELAFGLADTARGTSMRTDSILALGPASAGVVAVAMMQATEAKLLQLDDPVDPHLTVPVRNPVSPARAITFRELFAATSSIADNPVVLSPLVSKGDSPVSTEQFLEGYFGDEGLYSAPDNWKMVAPGTSSGASAVAVTLASYAIERRRQSDFAAETKARIFTPLGMTSTGYRLSDIDAARLASGHLVANDGSFAPQPASGSPLFPANGLRATAGDVGRLVAALSTGGVLEGRRVLEQASVDELLRVQSPLVVPGQCLAFMRDGEGWGFVGFAGGFSVLVSYRPASDTGLVLLFNGMAADSDSVAAIVARLEMLAATL